MKIKLLSYFSVALLLSVGACTTEDYYRNANATPGLMASVDLDRIDTIKTSAVSSQRTYTMSVTATDENLNMNMLFVNAPTGSIKIDGVAANSQAIETAKERGEFTRSVEFTPNNDGLHTITARVMDDFGNSNSLEKRVYSFTNMRPILGMSKSVIRSGWDAVTYYFDFSSSFDRDTRWGGAIDSMFVVIKCLYYIEATGDVEGGTINIRTSIADTYLSGVKTDQYVLYSLQIDDGVDYFTDAWVWVKDNEGAVSDTLRYTLGHVE